MELEGLNAAGITEIARAAEIFIPEPTAAAGTDDRAKGGELVPGKTIQLIVEQGSLDLADYSAEMTVRCSYKAGLFWPQAKSCGRRELPAALGTGGRLLIPPVEAFEGHQGRDLDNFSVSVVVREKGDAAGYLFSMDIRGRKALAAYTSATPVFSILKMDAGLAEVLVEGSPLAGSELSRDPAASLLSFVLVEPRTEESDGIMLVSPLGDNKSFDNLEYTSAGSLAGLKSLPLAPGVLAERADDRRKLELLTSLKVEGPDGNVTFRSSRIEIRKTTDGLKAIRQVDLR
ncbi:MAG: hypothetical protein A2X31_13010 [Elusimicrobia bacterium GWB2_63_22]|nr:MAG: hypothetical protein A2X31_13010 [Elusimicrobia bacterium GWB2_63_22]